MATEKRVTFTDHGEPVVVITITGWHDAFRFAWAMGHLQCEFADVARRIGGSLRRRIGAKAFADYQARFTSKTSLSWLRDDEDTPLSSTSLSSGEHTAASVGVGPGTGGHD